MAPKIRLRCKRARWTKPEKELVDIICLHLVGRWSDDTGFLVGSAPAGQITRFGPNSIIVNIEQKF